MNIETSSTIEQIKKVDKKVDKNDKVDEKQIIEKIRKTEKMFKSFASSKLEELKQKLPQDKFQKLSQEFKNLENNFNIDLKTLEKKLSELKENQFEEYQNIIKSMQDKFWGILEIKEWDTIYDIATKYLNLPEKWKKEVYSWFDLADWMVKNENLKSENLKIWDVIILPAEYSLVKSFLKYENKIDLKELWKKQNIKFKEWVSKEQKWEILILLLQFFKIKKNDEKIQFVLAELSKLAPKDNIKAPSLAKTTKNISSPLWDKEVLDYWNTNSIDIKNLSTTQNNNIDPSILKDIKDKYDGKWKDYSGFFWYFDWLKDGVIYWVAEQIESYKSLFNKETYEKIIWFLWNLSSKDILNIGKAFYNELKQIVSDIDFSDPHKLWKVIWKFIVNIVLSVIWAWWILKIWEKLSKIPKLAKLWALFEKTGKFLRSATWNISLDTFKNIKKVWFELLYHSWNPVLIVSLDTYNLLVKWWVKEYMEIKWIKNFKAIDLKKLWVSESYVINLKHKMEQVKKLGFKMEDITKLDKKLLAFDKLLNTLNKLIDITWKISTYTMNLATKPENLVKLSHLLNKIWPGFHKIMHIFPIKMNSTQAAMSLWFLERKLRDPNSNQNEYTNIIKFLLSFLNEPIKSQKTKELIAMWINLNSNTT